MSWVNLTAYKPNVSPKASDTVAVRAEYFALRICDVTMAKLHWRRGDLVALLSGDGAENGFIRVIKVKEHGWLIQAPGGRDHSGAGGIIRLGMGLARRFMPDVPPRMAARVVETRIVDGMMQFRLPWIPEKAVRDPNRPFAVDNLTIRPSHGRPPSRPETIRPMGE